ncbi:hypothetical protein THASP1DRAFT_31060 [Thamnocephalis sphaerospora]|uniref:Protein SirB1 N-terminal domain-containing protein n=1 Tax=Thamnocephalis sphaerospora TaxID=78915 RepID=A0A4P9XMH3_9FUNG|nr:hypothetical protein THASP1DRAFT_31060 [Thamnocephalis sphaerospora]|eukprot:RKP07127.1 hypothetical protein THASP1DRAFT_31060 [Thamnocephalis sphaerospora]
MAASKYRFILKLLATEDHLRQVVWRTSRSKLSQDTCLEAAAAFGLGAIDVLQRIKREAYLDGDLALLYEAFTALMYIQRRAVVSFWANTHRPADINAMSSGQQLCDAPLWQSLAALNLWVEPCADIASMVQGMDALERRFRTDNVNLCQEIGDACSDVSLATRLSKESQHRIPAELEMRAVMALHDYMFRTERFCGPPTSEYHYVQHRLLYHALRAKHGIALLLGAILQGLAARLGVRIDLMPFPMQVYARCRTADGTDKFVYFSLTGPARPISLLGCAQELVNGQLSDDNPAEVQEMYTFLQTLRPCKYADAMRRMFKNMELRCGPHNDQQLPDWQRARIHQFTYVWNLLAEPILYEQRENWSPLALEWPEDVALIGHVGKLVNQTSLAWPPKRDEWDYSPSTSRRFSIGELVTTSISPIAFAVAGYTRFALPSRYATCMGVCTINDAPIKLLDMELRPCSASQIAKTYELPGIHCAHQWMNESKHLTGLLETRMRLGPCFNLMLGRFFSRWDPVKMRYIARSTTADDVAHA